MSCPSVISGVLVFHSFAIGYPCRPNTSSCPSCRRVVGRRGPVKLYFDIESDNGGRDKLQRELDHCTSMLDQSENRVQDLDEEVKELKRKLDGLLSSVVKHSSDRQQIRGKLLDSKNLVRKLEMQVAVLESQSFVYRERKEKAEVQLSKSKIAIEHLVQLLHYSFPASDLDSLQKSAESLSSEFETLCGGADKAEPCDVMRELQHLNMVADWLCCEFESVSRQSCCNRLPLFKYLKLFKYKSSTVQHVWVDNIVLDILQCYKDRSCTILRSWKVRDVFHFHFSIHHGALFMTRANVRKLSQYLQLCPLAQRRQPRIVPPNYISRPRSSCTSLN